MARGMAGPAAPEFLSGGGEMGALIRAHDWAATPLGAPQTWPQPLRTAVRLILNTGHPMYIFWGTEGACFYNDAYRQSIGPERHPESLGQPARAVWTEIWDTIGPQIEQVMAGRGATWHENQLLPITRNGRREDVYWTYSYGPIDDEASATGIGGVLVVCTETTGQVLAERRARHDRAVFARLFEQAPTFMTMLSGPEHRIVLANPGYIKLVGGRDVVGKTVAEALPEVRGQGFLELLDSVFQSGEAYSAIGARYDLPATGLESPEPRYLDFVYQPIKDDEGAVTGIFVEGHDVTARREAEEALRTSEARYQSLFNSLDFSFYAVDQDWRLSVFNSAAEAFFGFAREDVLGRSLWELFPEGRDRPFGDCCRAAMERGEVSELDAPSALRPGRSVSLRFAPMAGGGASVSLFDVTERRRAERRRDALVELVRRFDEERETAEISFAAAEILGKTLSVDRVGYGTVDPISETIVIERDWNADGVQSLAGTLQFRDYGSYIENLVRGETVVIADVRDDARTSETADALIAINARSFVNMPVSEQGGLVALLYLNHGEPREWSEEDFAFIRDIAGRTRMAVERSRAETALRELNETLERQVADRTATLAQTATRLRAVFATSYQYQGLIDVDGTVLESNAASLAGIKAKAEDVAGMPFWDTPWFSGTPGMADQVRAAVAAVAGGATIRQEVFSNLPIGWRWFDLTLRPAFDAEGEIVAIVPEAIDITERRQAEEALRQSQKLEAMGQLTGGVAHDFNNLLSPIIGGLDMLQRRGLGGSREQRLIDGALQSAERAKTLVQRLLAFARRQPLQPSAVDVGRLVTGMGDLIASTTGPQIKVVLEVADGLPAANADANQVEMALLNLSVNARDAMPDGGTLRISADEEAIGHAHRSGLPVGRYVRLSVADTGSGMDDATAAKAIEPFFSTKGIGKGTGLGLSMVHGLATQLGGTLRISSRAGLGTNIEIWLPVSTNVFEAMGESVEMPTVGRHVGRALVVDDEALVRASTADMLAELGYAVLEAASAEEALGLIAAGETIDLLVTDHLMPGMTGVDLVREVRSRRPDLPVLIVSGYADADQIAPDLPRLSKPFRQPELAAGVAAVVKGD